MLKLQYILLIMQVIRLLSVQYIPKNMHTVFALLCFVVVIHWLIFPYPSGLLDWHCGNLTIAPVPAKQPWWIWINTSCTFERKIAWFSINLTFQWLYSSQSTQCISIVDFLHYERLLNHNKAKHNKTVWIFLGIYCMLDSVWLIHIKCPSMCNWLYE